MTIDEKPALDLDRINVRDFLAASVDRHADTPLLVWEGTEVTYRDFHRHVRAYAAAWASLGLRKGDRVAFMLDNCPEFLYAWLGAAQLGGVLVAVNTGFQRDETRYVIEDCQARFVLVGDAHVAVVASIAADLPGVEGFFVDTTGGTWPCLPELARRDLPPAPDVELTGDDLISLIYTSGTTGHPKGVMQTHRNFVLTGQAYPAWLGMSTGERIYACLPLFHINSQSYSLMGAIGAGGAIVLARRFSATRFWPDVRASRVNYFNFIGAMTVILSKVEPSERDRDHQVKVAYGVPALPVALREQIEERFGLTVISGFGMSETTFGLIEDLHGERRPQSMGQPRQHPDPSVPRNEARVIDDDGNDVPDGTVGELVFRNPALMAGYFRDPDRTAQTLRDGWLRSGDLAWRDSDGFYYFADRKKDIVRRRGENVSSLEVENVLNAHPAVLESAIVGVPSDLTDEDLLAVIVPRAGHTPDAADIIAWAADRLAPFKVPRFIRFDPALPKTVTQKIEKHRLRSGWDPTRAAYDHQRPARRATPGPAVVLRGEEERFYASAAAGRLDLHRCDHCGHAVFYPRPVCPVCHHDTLTPQRAAGTGTVYSYTVLRRPGRPELAADVPYVVALIELEEGVRVMGNVQGLDPDEVRIGLAVRVRFEDQGNGLTAPQWVAA